MKRTLDLSYDEIVIGADLSALCYSYVNSVPIIYLRHLKPYKKPYDSYHYPYDDDISDNNLDLWNDLMFQISFNNLSPFADNIQSIRIVDNNNLKAVSKENYIINIKFNKLVISDDYKVSGLPNSCGMTDSKNLVVDFFKTISGRKIFQDSTSGGHKFFPYWLDFYKSKRYINNPDLKDIACYSKLSNKQLQDVNYSHSMVKIKILRTLRYIRIEPDKGKKLSIIHERREIYPLGKNKYKDLPPNFIMLYDIPDIKNKKANKYFDYVKKCLNGNLNSIKAFGGDSTNS